MALFSKDSIPTKPATPARRAEAPNQFGNPPGTQADKQADNMQKSGSSTKKSGDTAPHPASESRLIVGPNIKLKGVEIEDCDTLVVEGYVEASMDSRVIEIAESGVYKGKVDIDTAIIRGRFEGELTARDRLIVHETGDVSGKIRYGRLAIEEGGRIHGDLDELHNTKAHAQVQAKDDDSKAAISGDKGASATASSSAQAAE